MPLSLGTLGPDCQLAMDTGHLLPRVPTGTRPLRRIGGRLYLVFSCPRQQIIDHLMMPRSFTLEKTAVRNKDHDRTRGIPTMAASAATHLRQTTIGEVSYLTTTITDPTVPQGTKPSIDGPHTIMRPTTQTVLTLGIAMHLTYRVYPNLLDHRSNRQLRDSEPRSRADIAGKGRYVLRKRSQAMFPDTLTTLADSVQRVPACPWWQVRELYEDEPGVHFPARIVE